MSKLQKKKKKKLESLANHAVLMALSRTNKSAAERNNESDDAKQQQRQQRLLTASQGMATNSFSIECSDLKSTRDSKNGKKSRGIGSKNAHKIGVSTTFAGEADYDVERRVRDARRPIGTHPRAYKELLVNCERMRSGEAIEFMPTRPKWSETDSKKRVSLCERKEFANWARRVKEKMVERGGYPPAFEQNLEVWKQLWRALERADVVCCVLDARNPMLHFPAALYAHACRVHKKPLICALNKIDGVPSSSAEKWRKHLLAGLPGVDEVIGFVAVGFEEKEEESTEEE